jgi:Xaa-Pro aminopeptidase
MFTQQKQTDLCIPESEFRSRVEKVHDFVKGNNLGGLLVYSGPRAHMWYQTGHVGWLTNWANRDRITDSMVLVPAEGEVVLLFSGLPFMLPQIKEVSWMKDIRIVRSADPNAVAVQPGAKTIGSSKAGDFAGEAAAILNKRGLAGKPVGLVGIENMPVPFYEALLKGLGADRLRVVEDIIAQLRAVKSSNEIKLIRRAAELSDLGYETFIKVARPGMPGIKAIAEAERAVRDQGGEDVMYWIANVADGHWDESIVDIKPTPRILNYGDQIMMCSYVVYKGYWAHCHRCGSLGKEAREMRHIWEPGFEAHCAAVDKMQPGTPVSEVVRAARLVAEKHGYALHGGRIGHGIGLDYSEQPFLSEANQTPLKKGNVVIVHTLFSLPGKGTFLVPVGDLCYLTDTYSIL